MKMGHLMLVTNVIKTAGGEADRYYDTKTQAETGDEGYVRFTPVEIRDGLQRGYKQADEVDKSAKLGHFKLTPNTRDRSGNEASYYFDMPLKLKDAIVVARFTSREMARGLRRGITQGGEIKKTSWWRNWLD